MEQGDTPETGIKTSKRPPAVPEPYMSKTLVHPVDFSPIDSQDPSLRKGYKIIYLREVPVEIRFQESKEKDEQVGSLEAIKIKVLVQKLSLIESEHQKTLPLNSPRAKQSHAEQIEKSKEITSVRLELTSEADLFFHFVHQVDRTCFENMRQQQRLMITFEQYPSVLLSMLNACVDQATSNLAIFVIREIGDSRLDFIKNLEYKYVELMRLQCIRTEEDEVREQIAFRYNALKAKLEMTANRLHEVSTVLKVKNPSLLLQISRTPGACFKDLPLSKSKTKRYQQTLRNNINKETK